MALGNYSGLKKVEYSTDGTTYVDLGTPLADSPGIGDEIQTAETGKGTQLYSGKKREHVFHITDLSLFAALETIMKADTEIYVRVTDLEGNTDVVCSAATCQVKKVLGASVGSRNYFEFKVQEFDV